MTSIARGFPYPSTHVPRHKLICDETAARDAARSATAQLGSKMAENGGGQDQQDPKFDHPV
ncbi:hypothetical protein RRF57_002136 [Xylaria bambusicola]|uniref:Uncharacterized protein n=1 Tax=Xylaria bambusicola TaxID=326684 RepID=A0AAN7Z6P4_9PEZI